MKTKLLSIAFLAIIFLVSCTKDIDQPINTTSQSEIAKNQNMEPGPVSCPLPDDACGSQCAGNLGGCWETTECKANTESYHQMQQTLYAQEEIDRMAAQNTPISDLLLLQILKNDGILPLM